MIIFVTAIIVLIVILIIALFLFNSWDVHVQMVKQSSNSYNYATFKKFMSEFNKAKDRYNLIVDGDSIFIRDTNRKNIAYVHASIIKFSDNGMILYPISWAKFLIWKNKYCKPYKQISHREKTLWN